MEYRAINFQQKFGLFSEHWLPKVVAELNDHDDTDEAFIVIEGNLRIDFRDGAVDVGAGEMFVVPRGVPHKTSAEREVKMLLIEPRGVPNTGHEGGERTAPNDVWV